MSSDAPGDDPFDGFLAPIREDEILCPRNLRVAREIGSYAQSAVVAIAMPLHNQASTLYFALESALSQTLAEGHCAVVLLDDQSTDDWQTEIADLLEHPGLIVLKGHCGSAALARNAILDFVESDLPNVRWVARLDPDDLLCSSTSVAALVSEGALRGETLSLAATTLNETAYPSNRTTSRTPIYCWIANDWFNLSRHSALDGDKRTPLLQPAHSNTKRHSIPINPQRGGSSVGSPTAVFPNE